MKPFFKTVSLASLSAFFLAYPAAAWAQIRNPALDPILGNDLANATSGQTFVSYFVTIWQALITVGGLAVIVYFIWGGIDWITAGGDSSKVQKARDKMTQAGIGLIILVGSFTILAFISTLFFGTEFDILNPTIRRPG